MRFQLVVMALALGACSKSAEDNYESNPEFEQAQKHDAPKREHAPNPAAPAIDPCSPEGLKLPKAKVLAPWVPPADCAAQGAGTAILKTEASAAKRFDCKGAKLGVDFTKTALVVTTRSLSPATVGILALDDGKAISFVSQYRSPCPKDPRPMPSPDMTFAYAIETGDRVFHEASCTMERNCP